VQDYLQTSLKIDSPKPVSTVVAYPGTWFCVATIRATFTLETVFLYFLSSE